MSTKTIEQQIEELVAQIEPLTQQLDKLRCEKRRKDSRDFIAANHITKDDVELMEGDDKPYFGDIAGFVEWLTCHSRKRWAEWNGVIYFQSDLKVGRMLDTPARADDL